MMRIWLVFENAASYLSSEVHKVSKSIGNSTREMSVGTFACLIEESCQLAAAPLPGCFGGCLRIIRGEEGQTDGPTDHTVADGVKLLTAEDGGSGRAGSIGGEM